MEARGIVWALSSGRQPGLEANVLPPLRGQCPLSPGLCLADPLGVWCQAGGWVLGSVGREMAVLSCCHTLTLAFLVFSFEDPF